MIGSILNEKRIIGDDVILLLPQKVDCVQSRGHEVN